MILSVDRVQEVYEADESNNLLVQRIEITPPGGPLRIQAFKLLTNHRLHLAFTSQAGLSYQIEATKQLVDPEWVLEPFFLSEDGTRPVETIQGTGELLNLYLEPFEQMRFYRVGSP